MSYRFVYPNTGATVGAAAPVTGYGIDPNAMSAGYPNRLQSNTYNSHRQR
jgi:hypothetical protein